MTTKKNNLKPGEAYLLDVPRPISRKHSALPLTPPENKKSKGWTILSYEEHVVIDSSVGSIQLLKKAQKDGVGKLTFLYLLKWPWGGKRCNHEESLDGTSDRCLSCLGSDWKGGWVVNGQIAVLVLEIQKGGGVPYDGLRALTHFNKHIAPNDVLYDKKKNVAWRISRVRSDGDVSGVPFTWNIWARELLPGDLKDETQFSNRVEEYEKKLREKIQLTKDKSKCHE